jgi:HSP20 family molecular chaperone IbpA
VRLRLPLASAEEIKRHFEQRIRERWGSRVPEPPADVFVLSEEIWVELDLPGVLESGVRAYVERDELVVEARREIQPPPGTLSTARRERSPGVIERRVPLPPMHRSPRLEIHLESGVLRVRVLWEEPP